MTNKVFYIMPIVSRKRDKEHLDNFFIQMREEEDKRKKAMKELIRNSRKKKQHWRT